MRKYALLVLAAGLSLGFAPAPLPKPPKPDGNKEELKKLQGTWMRVALSNNQPGGGAPAGVEGTRVVIAGNRMTYVLASTALNEWSITLDVTKKPKVFDNEGIGSLPSYRGIYRLDGDTLTICSRPGSTEADRPADLEGTQPRVVREVFLRQRP